MDLHAEHDGVLRREESVLRDRLKNMQGGNLRGESSTMCDDGFAVVSVPNVDCREGLSVTTQDGLQRRGLTFDAAATLLQRSNVAFDRALALELTTDKVGLRAEWRQREKRSNYKRGGAYVVTRAYKVLGDRTRHVLL